MPREAVNIGPDGQYVFAVSGKKAVEKPVKVLFDNDKDIAIEGDLVPGEEVVVDGQLRLVPGATVLVIGAGGAARGAGAAGGAGAARGARGGRGKRPAKD